MCILIGDKDAVSVEDEILPQSTEATEGQDAMFQCKFSISETTGRSTVFSFDFEFTTHTLIGNETLSNSFKTSYYFEGSRYYPDCIDCPFSVNLTIPDKNTQSTVLLFNIKVPQVSKDLNESTFSCSITYHNGDQNLLQWKKVATLSVVEGESNIKYVSVISLLVVVLLVAVMTTTIATLVRRRKYRQRSTQVNPDEGNLVTATKGIAKVFAN